MLQGLGKSGDLLECNKAQQFQKNQTFINQCIKLENNMVRVFFFSLDFRSTQNFGAVHG